MSQENVVLVINPGSTSTKVSLFSGENVISTETLRHSAEEIAQFPKTMDQLEFRKKAVLDFVEKSGVSLSSLNIVVGRGGTLPPMEGGVYVVDDSLINALKANDQGHASSLGGIIAKEIADPLFVPAFIVDPVTTDELDSVARYSGIPDIERKSVFHALNQKAIARRAASSIGKSYNDCTLVVVHLGGGISVGTHKNGRVIEVANALDGDGPFSPERSGGLPVTSFIELCYSGKYSHNELKKLLVGKGGLVAYCNSNNLLDIEKAIAEEDEEAKLYYQAMAYQVAKEVGRCASVVNGDVDAIVLTGGAARSKMLVEWIKSRIEFISQVLIFPGEDEMEALAIGGLRVVSGEEIAKHVKQGGGIQ